MNTDLIETRAEALALVDADLITIQDYVALCRFKNWHPTGDAASPAERIMPAERATPLAHEGSEAPRRSPYRPMTGVESFRSEASVLAPVHSLRPSIRSA